MNGCDLVEAAQKNDLKRVKASLDSGIDIESVCDHGGTTLMAAAGKGHTEVAALLIKSGARINVQGLNRSTALMQAVRFHKYDCIKLLLANGADKALRDMDGNYALSIAKKNQDIKAIQLLGK